MYKLEMSEENRKLFSSLCDDAIRIMKDRKARTYDGWKCIQDEELASYVVWEMYQLLLLIDECLVKSSEENEIENKIS